MNDSGQPGRADQDFEEIEIAEEELIDAYVHNELSTDERKLVEKGLRRSPQLAERLHFARMLAKASSSAREFVPSPSGEPETLTDRTQAEPVEISWWKRFFSASLVPRPAFRVALGVCVVFVLIGGVGLIVGWMKLRNESNRLALERAAVEQQRLELEKRLAEQKLGADELMAQLQKEREQREAAEKIIEVKLPQKRNDQSNPSAITNLATILLFPNGIRGSGANELQVSPAASEIRLDLSLETAEYSRYRVVIQSSGEKVIAQRGVRVRHTRSGPVLSIRVPAQRLPQGDYQIHVSGLTSSGVLDPVEDYVFRVTENKE